MGGWKMALPMILLAIAAQAEAAPVTQAGPLASKVRQVVPLLNGALDPSAAIAPDMLRQLPAAQISASFAQIRQVHGKAIMVEAVEPMSEVSALVTLRTEKSRLKIRIAIEPRPPHLFTGILVEAAETLNDSVDAVMAELAALPGKASISIAALGEGAPRPISARLAAQPMAIGSAFKLFVLAELVRQINAGERRWTDVVPLAHRSLPSGLLQDWPAGSPLTIHSLAALMISRSDNSAADTLLHLVGREKVELLLPALGIKAPERNRPFLSTREAFAIKADPSLIARWTAADEARRRAMLPPLDSAGIDPAALSGPPKAIDQVEWFAAPDELVSTVDWLRRNGDDTARAILAINPGIGKAAADSFDYLGYKGGSETGVIQMTFLLRRKDGAWRAVAATWNNPASAVDEARFVSLVARLVALQK